MEETIWLRFPLFAKVLTSVWHRRFEDGCYIIENTINTQASTLGWKQS